jgi:tetratricopeptide (TPR) repeat protein
VRNLGSIALDKKEYPRALELFARALVLREKVLGARHPDVAGIRNEIADVYHEMGDDRKSIETRRLVLDILNETASPYHRLFPLVFEGFAVSYAALGDSANALDYQKRSQEAFEKNIALNLAAGSEKVKLEYLRQASWGTDRTISLQTQLAPDDTDARELAALLLQRKGRVLDALSSNIATLR